MRSMALFETTRIDITTDTEVGRYGHIRTTTITGSHGNAQHCSFGLLHGEGRDWWVTETGADGTQHTLLVRRTKRGAVEAFANLATARAAQWAAHRDTI